MIGPDGFPSDTLIDAVLFVMLWIAAGGAVLVAVNPNKLVDSAQRRYLQRHGRLAPAWYECLALFLAMVCWPLVVMVRVVKVAKAVRR